MTEKEFDPLAYIEQAFSDTKPESVAVTSEAIEIVDEEAMPSISEFLARTERPEGDERAATTSRGGRVRRGKTSEKLSAPRPRRRKQPRAQSAIDPTIEELWTSLPRNIKHLSKHFDDKVTSNYYRGEFKESRDELIKRLLDPELTLEEVSRLLGVCPATVRRYTNRDWLQHHRTQGGQRRFRLSNVAKFIEEHGREIVE